MNTDLTPIALFVLDIAIILVAARILGLVARRVGQPPVVGEIIAGILLGPTLFNHKVADWLFNGHAGKPVKPKGKPPHVFDMIGTANVIGSLTAIATIGLILFMFIVGYEVDRTLFKGREQVAVSVSLGSIALPMVGGTLLGLWLYDRHPGIKALGLDKTPTALFVGAAMSVTAFPVLARILTDRGMHRTRLGSLSIASAAVDDIAAWTLLAVVVGIAGASGDDSWHIYWAPAYLLIMYFGARPLLRMVNNRFLVVGRLTPDQLSVVVVVVSLSSFATEWLNVHFIFGAFIAGACMPREGGQALRVAILERLEQLSVLVLLPVFFVTSGVKVDLSKLDLKDFGELFAILGVAIGGKFIGAYLGAKSVGVGGRQAGALATLMNTRGLTELIILNVGLQLGVLDAKLFSLMVLMALVTTAMTGPILRFIYPKRLIDRDIADAERAALSAGAAYRVLVVVNRIDDTDLVDFGVDLAASHPNAEVLLTRLVPQKPTDRLEVGTGMGSDLLVMTRTLSELHALGARGADRGVTVPVYAKFSEDLPHDLTALIIEVDPDLVLVDEDTELAPHDFMPRVVRKRAAMPDGADSVVVLPGGGAANAAAALRTGAQVAVGRRVDLVLAGGAARLVGDLAKHGIRATAGEVSDTSIVVGAVDESGTHLVARARPSEEAENIDEWAGSLSAQTPAGGSS